MGASFYKKTTATSEVYELSYRFLRELWDPAYNVRRDRKESLRQLRQNNPAAYQAAFHHFWANKRDIQERRKVKKLWQEVRYEAWKKRQPPPPPLPAAVPFTYPHIRQWLIEKGLIPKDAR